MPDTEPPLLATRAQAVDVALALLALLANGPAALAQRVDVPGVSMWLLGDDAMISLRYARNLAQGHGLVFNAGERVEGITNPLWTLWMTLGFVPGVPREASALPALLGALAAAALLPGVTRRLARALGAPAFPAVVAGVAVALSRDVGNWAVQGFETVPLALVLCVAALRVTHEAPRDTLGVTTLALLSMVPGLRSDGVVHVALLAALALGLATNPRALLPRLVVPFGVFAAMTLARLGYYGDIVPNTARLKVFVGSARLAAGARYVYKALAASPVHAIGPLAALIFAPRAARWVAGSALAWVAWVLWVGGDAFPGRRFMVPALPLALALVAVASARAPSAYVRGLLALGVLVAMPLRLPGVTDPLRPAPSPRDRDNLRIGELLRTRTPRNAVIAEQWAGTTLYVSERRGVDLLGKVDRHVATRAPVYPGPAPGHNRWDLAWSLGTLRPDYVVAPVPVPVPSAYRAALVRPALRFARALVEDEHFLRACAPHPMPWPTQRTVLRCQW